MALRSVSRIMVWGVGSHRLLPFAAYITGPTAYCIHTSLFFCQTSRAMSTTRSISLVAKLPLAVIFWIKRAIQCFGPEDNFLFMGKENRDVVVLYTTFTITDPDKFYNSTPFSVDQLHGVIEEAFQYAAAQPPPMNRLQCNGRIHTMGLWDRYVPIHVFLGLTMNVQDFFQDFGRRVLSSGSTRRQQCH